MRVRVRLADGGTKEPINRAGTFDPLLIVIPTGMESLDVVAEHVQVWVPIGHPLGEFPAGSTREHDTVGVEASPYE